MVKSHHFSQKKILVRNLVKNRHLRWREKLLHVWCKFIIRTDDQVIAFSPQKRVSNNVTLAHFGLVTPNGGKDLGSNWFR